MAKKLYIAKYDLYYEKDITSYHGVRIFADREKAIEAVATASQKARDDYNFTDDDVLIDTESRFAADNELYNYDIEIIDMVFDGAASEYVKESNQFDSDDAWI